jgi:redox-sensitive bicupin YhaK (pirin superfamily)
MKRSIARVLPSIRTLEGGGFWVRRPFPNQIVDHLDPFLLLDQMGPTEVKPGEAKGAPDHPHRGFETVTYILSGEMEHRDSAGNAGSLGPGDVQWMTAGDGVVHSEMPSRRFQETGGKLLGFQLWVNLPARDKRMKPRYQELKAASIPTAETAGAKVKVIAGEALGVRAAIDTRTPIFYLHWSLRPGARITQKAPRDYNTFAWVISGEANGASEGHAIWFADDGDEIELTSEKGAELLLIGGVPLREPVARYGPFVMNKDEELIEAFQDFQSGRMGTIRGT